MTIRPEDVLSDTQDYAVIQGIKVRKGTIAAVLQNAAILASSVSAIEKENAKHIINELAHSLIVLGMDDHVSWKNPEIQAIIEDTKKKLRL